jgi:hypothetical protein
MEVCNAAAAERVQQHQQQPAFLESLPALPQPGTPEFEFSTESFLQRFEMSEVLGEVREVILLPKLGWPFMHCQQHNKPNPP